MKREKQSQQAITIAISGAGETGHCGIDALEQAKQLGVQIAQHGAVLATGATTGFPMWTAMGAEEAGGTIIGFSPAASRHEHEHVYRLALDHISVPIYTGFGHTGRDLLMVRSADAIIFGCGRISSVNEFTIAYKEEKVIGVLQGSWNTDKLLREIVEEAHDEKRDIIFDTDPRRLVEQVVRRVKEQQVENNK
jgi:uncharacterized protein (TIGR00725 family)